MIRQNKPPIGDRSLLDGFPHIVLWIQVRLPSESAYHCEWNPAGVLLSGGYTVGILRQTATFTIFYLKFLKIKSKWTIEVDLGRKPGDSSPPDSGLCLPAGRR